MSSKYGAKHNLPGYDAFRTGLCYRDVWMMLYDESDDPANWRYKSRHTVLGLWHSIKLQLYEQAVYCGYLQTKE